MALTSLPMRRVAESLLLPAVTAAVRTAPATPALDLMTDFLATEAMTIDACASLGEAERRMRECGLGLLIVLDEPPCVMGVVDARDLRGERAAWPTAQPGRAPDEWRVVDVVTQLRDLDTLDLATLATATPAQMVETLRRSGQNHLLVIEPSGSAVSGRLRGVVTQAQAEQQARAPAPDVSRMA
jgi:CBS-domain-containing membrane protein